MSSRLVGMTAWISGLQKSRFWPKIPRKTREKQRFSDSGLWPGLGGRAKREEFSRREEVEARARALIIASLRSENALIRPSGPEMGRPCGGAEDLFESRLEEQFDLVSPGSVG